MDAEHMETLAEEFEACRKVLLVLGDENRQHLLLEMMQMNRCGGARVGEITARTHLSRPAVSHHLRILKEADILSVRQEGTKNFYFFNPEATGLRSLMQMLEHASAILEQQSKESEETR